MKSLLMIVLLVTSWATEAAMYKWTDANGKTVYSQSPPPTGEINRIRLRSTPEEETAAAQQRLQQQLQNDADRREDQELAKQKSDIEQKERQSREKRCQAARHNLEVYTSNAPNRLIQLEDGSFARLTVEQRQAKIDAMQKILDQDCQK